MRKTTRGITALFTAVALTLSMTLNAAADRVSVGDTDGGVAAPRSSSNIAMLQRQYPNGSRFTGSYDGAYQCMGFAYYCYYMYNDDHVNETISDGSRSYYSLVSNSNLENFLRTAGTQCYVRGRTSNGVDHSIFIVGYSTRNKTVTVYDCNMDGNCGVRFDTYSYDDFRIHMRSVLFCYTSDGVFLDYQVF